MHKPNVPVSRIAAVAVFALGVGIVPTGCASPKSVGTTAAQEYRSKPATATTPARGTMKAGARSRKHKTSLPNT